VNRNLGFFTTGYDYMIQLLPILIVAPLFVRGQVEFGLISQSAMAFSHLISAFSLWSSPSSSRSRPTRASPRAWRSARAR
jgi:ABC-type uncharacterized transport system fused permease/ATPase subunit